MEAIHEITSSASTMELQAEQPPIGERIGMLADYTRRKKMTELTGIALLRQVIPDEFANQLALISLNWRRDKFAIGDIRNSLKAMVEEKLLPISAPDIDDFLADCINHEVEPRTVRYYAMIAYSFPEPIREQYDTLSHAHFAFAHSLGDDKALEALQMAKDRELTSGRVPSIAWLRSALNGYIYEQNSRMFSDNSEDIEPIYNDPSTSRCNCNLEPATDGWLIRLQKVVKFGIDHIDAVPIPSEARLKLSDLLSQVDSLLCQYIMV
jgi:hypothetical protein